MSERTATIASRVGLHARPAGIFVAAVRKAGVPVTIAMEGEPEDDAMDASSILSLMSLGAANGSDTRLSIVRTSIGLLASRHSSIWKASLTSR